MRSALIPNRPTHSDSPSQSLFNTVTLAASQMFGDSLSLLNTDQMEHRQWGSQETSWIGSRKNLISKLFDPTGIQ